MKAIINGKTYNTETAEELGSYTNGLSYSDFRHLRESLYKTPKGAYFLSGVGGAMTNYGEDVGGGRVGGSGIHLFSEAEAFKWAEMFMPTDDVEKHFSHLLTEA